MAVTTGMRGTEMALRRPGSVPAEKKGDDKPSESSLAESAKPTAAPEKPLPPAPAGPARQYKASTKGELRQFGQKTFYGNKTHHEFLKMEGRAMDDEGMNGDHSRIIRAALDCFMGLDLKERRRFEHRANKE